jgi:hypothetical protein
MSFVKTDIENYVQANEKVLIGKAILGGKTAGMLNLQTGVKKVADINILTTSTVLQDGSSCGFNASGTATFTKRQITALPIKVQESYCEKDLIGTSMQWQVKIEAGLETMPWEEMIIGKKIADVILAKEYTIWQGDNGNTGATYQRFDGFLTILTGGTVDGSINSATTLANYPVEVINNVVANIPVAILDRPDLVVFVGLDIFRKYIAALQAKNLYHYTDNLVAGNFSTQIYGTNIKLEGVAGLNGTNKVFATYLENMIAGTDLEGSDEVVDFWYSKDDQLFKFNILFNYGVQVAFPDLVVIAS